MNDLFSIDMAPQLPFTLPDEDGYSAQWDDALKGFHITVPQGELFYAEYFFDQKVSNRCVNYFTENSSHHGQQTDWHTCEQQALNEVDFTNIQWQHDKLNMYGKTVYLPRFSAWYGDSDKPYTYSGLALQPKPWNKGLLYIKERIEQVTPSVFNSVLMNWYRDGDDYIGWHTDEEPELGKNPVIASANFGESRDFVIKHNESGQKLSLPLGNGTLLIMKGTLQHYWKHSLPKRKKVKHARFNLTFREIKA
jgi:alkylated DNA repair dioxygenase AlkB